MIDYPTVEHALRTADPEALPEALREALLGMGVSGVEVHLADYALRVLTPVAVPHDAAPVPIHGSVPGRAFASQQPQYQQFDEGATAVTVPVSVRGDRHGTLTAHLPAGAAGPAAVEALRAIGRLLGHELVVAERDTSSRLNHSLT